MKSATVRQLRHDFGSVLAWVEEGEQVQISKRGRIVAMISPPPPPPRRKAARRPDFVARMKRIFGDTPLAGKNPVLEDRESRPY